MKWYPWLRSYFEQLITEYQTGNGHHSLLIQALPGMGDEALVYAIARFLMCQQPERHKSCNECCGCQLMTAGTHPDYYLLSPEKGKTTLGINAVREVNEKLYECARLGGAKVIWITDIALLTEEAANALLKVLEEPPKKTWFFLSYHESGRLLATLRSRCRLYYLAIPQESWSMAWLRREITTFSKETMMTALRLHNGAPAAALAFLRSEMYSRRKHFFTSLKEIVKSCDWLSLLSVLNNNSVLEYLYWLISLFLDALKIKYGISPLLISNIDNQALVISLARCIPITTLQTMFHSTCDCRDKILTIAGINCELLLTNQLLHIEYYLQSEQSGRIVFNP